MLAKPRLKVSCAALYKRRQVVEMLEGAVSPPCMFGQAELLHQLLSLQLPVPTYSRSSEHAIRWMCLRCIRRTSNR